MPMVIPYVAAVRAPAAATPSEHTEKVYLSVKELGPAVLSSEIATAEQADAMSSVLKDVCEAIKDVEKWRALAKKPYLDGGREVDAAFRPVLKVLEDAETSVRAGLNRWIAVREQKIAAARAEQLRREAEARIAAAPGQVPALVLDVPAAPDLNVNVRKHTQLEVFDPDSIPSDFWTINYAAVEAALKAGVEVPGARLVQVAKAVAR